MNTRATEIRTYHDLQAQADLERMLKARRDAEAARAARFAKQPEPANFCAESDDTDSPIPAMLLWAAAGLAAWALFGWSVVELIRAFTGIAS